MLAAACLGRISVKACRHAAWCTVPLLPLIALYHYHMPSFAAARAAIDRTMGDYTDDILAAHCTHVAGDFWKIWPTVFHANLKLYEQGQHRTIWAIGKRDTAIVPLWRNMPRKQIRIAIPLGFEGDVASHLEELGLAPLVEVDRRATIRVLKCGPVFAGPCSRPVGHRPPKLLGPALGN
jgi:hypothetical protein